MSTVADLQAKLTSLGYELSDLREARTALSRVSTSIPYKLGGYDRIASIYGLKGDKYEQQASAEEEVVKSMQKTFKAHKSDVLAALDRRIREVSSQHSYTYVALVQALTDGNSD